MGGGGCSITCSCGRLHFEDEARSWDWGKGEIEALQRDAKAHPDKYIACTFTPTYSTLQGRTFVHGCQCNGMRPYEDFIWAHRHGIAKYLRARSDDAIASAKLDHSLVGDLDKVALT